MPTNYVPVGKQYEKDEQNPINNRVKFIECLFRGRKEDCAAAIAGITPQKLHQMLQYLRRGAHLWAVPKINRILIAGLSDVFPHL